MYNISTLEKTIIKCKESYLTICSAEVYTFLYFSYNHLRAAMILMSPTLNMGLTPLYETGLRGKC